MTTGAEVVPVGGMVSRTRRDSKPRFATRMASSVKSWVYWFSARLVLSYTVSSRITSATPATKVPAA